MSPEPDASKTPRPVRKPWGRPPEVHVLVCTNERPPGNPKGSCAEKGGVRVFDALKQAVEARGVRGQVQVNRTNCLKPCAWGCTVVVQPRGDWYGRVTPEDAGEVIDAALEGRTVERLQLPDEAYDSF